MKKISKIFTLLLAIFLAMPSQEILVSAAIRDSGSEKAAIAQGNFTKVRRDENTEDSISEDPGITRALVIESLDGTWTYDGEYHTKQEYKVTFGGEQISASEGSNGREFALWNEQRESYDILTITPSGKGDTGIKYVSESTTGNNTFDYVITRHTEIKAEINVTSEYKNITTNFGTLTVRTGRLSITSASGSWLYDGRNHTKEEYTVKYDNKEYQAEYLTTIIVEELNNYPLNYYYALLDNEDLVVIAPLNGNYPLYGITYPGSLDNKFRCEVLRKTMPSTEPIDENPIKTAGEPVDILEEYPYSVGYEYGKESEIAIFGTLTVTLPKLTIESASKTWTFDGQYHTCQEYTVTLGGEQLEVTKVEENNYSAVFPNGDVLHITPITLGRYGVCYPSNCSEHNNEFSYRITREMPDPEVVQLRGTENVTSEYGEVSEVATYGTLLIEFADLVITSADGVWEYDGSRHTKQEYTVKLGEETLTEFTVQEENGVNHYYYELPFKQGILDIVPINLGRNGVCYPYEGTAKNNQFTATVYKVNGPKAPGPEYIDVTSEYNITRNFGTLDITSKEIEIISANGSWPYDGQYHTKQEYTIKYDGVELTTSEYTVEGTKYVYASLPTGDVITVWAIDKAPNGVGATGVKDADGSYANNNTFTYTITYTFEDRGELRQTIIDTSEHYEGHITETVGTLSITQKLIIKSLDKEWSYDSLTHKNTEYEVTYGGQPISVYQTYGSSRYFNLPGGIRGEIIPEDIGADGRGASGITNVAENAEHNNTFRVVFNTPEQPDYLEIEIEFGTIKINPYRVDILAGSATKEYDGQPLTFRDWRHAHGISVNDDHQFTVEYTDDSTITNAGSQPNKIKTVDGVAVSSAAPTAIGNYMVYVYDGTLTVNPFAMVLWIQGNSDEVTYNGLSQNVTGYEIAFRMFTGDEAIGNAYGENDYTFRGPAIAEGKDVGTYNMNLNSGMFTNNNPNYSVSFVIYQDGKLIIDPREVTVTADDKSKVENNADPQFTATEEGLLDGDSITYTITREPGEKAGRYAITPSGDENQGNYHVTYINGTLIIIAQTPATGDGTNMLLWSLIGLGAVAALAAVIYVGLSEEDEEEEEKEEQ